MGLEFGHLVNDQARLDKQRPSTLGQRNLRLAVTDKETAGTLKRRQLHRYAGLCDAEACCRERKALLLDHGHEGPKRGQGDASLAPGRAGVRRQACHGFDIF